MTARRDNVLLDIWAKSAKDSARGESLVAHTATVLSRLESLFMLLPGLAERVGDTRLWHRAALSCLLHDFGKSAAGFQAQLRQPNRPWKRRHEVLSLAFLTWLLPEDSPDLAWVSAGVCCHHRDLPEILQLYSKQPDTDARPAAPLVADLTEDAIRALAESFVRRFVQILLKLRLPIFACAATVPAEPVADLKSRGENRIYNALALARRLNGHLSRQAPNTPENLAAIALRGLVLMADHSASAHVRPKPCAITSVVQALQSLRLTREDLYEHQRKASSHAGTALLTAPTGSGKTEAAILWASRQYDDGEPAGRLYYVLPYQASLNAMHHRLESHFPDAVALQHSRALQALYRMLLESGSGYSAAHAQAAARRQRSLARLHYHPIRVLTPYQLLRAAFRLKGYEALLTDTFNGLFIFDEIHAYEPDRFGMILGLMEYFAGNFGARFLVMSATFPRAVREALAPVIGDAAPITADAALYQQFRRHVVRLLPGALANPVNVDAVVEAVRGGSSVLVVCNTVDGARELRQRFASLLDPDSVELLHGRFNARDRFRKEQQLLDRMGTRKRDRSGVPIVMVATQVVEVSLDLDFDVLFSEPAPLESLLQRFGRINRARRQELCPVYVATAPLDGHGIYKPEYVAGAIRVLTAVDKQPIDESHLGQWLDSIYEGSLANDWRQQVEAHREEFVQACLKDLRAFESKPELTERFDALFDGNEVLPICLRGHYDADEPLAASELLVPISSRQFGRLRREGRVLTKPGDYPIIVDARYDSETGLELNL